MKRVTGIGGIFFKANDAPALQAWYKKHLGIDVQDWGSDSYGRGLCPSLNTVQPVARKKCGAFAACIPGSTCEKPADSGWPTSHPASPNPAPRLGFRLFCPT